MPAVLPLAAALLLSGCEITPPTVNRVDVDTALSRKNYKIMCVGLDVREDDVRTYTTERFIGIADAKEPDPEGVEAGRACICANVLDEQGRIDIAVAKGMEDTTREDVVQCLADVVKDPKVGHRIDAIAALEETRTKVARDTMAGLARADTDIEVRVSAIKALAG